MNNNYLTYKAEDLATDDQFIEWIKSGRPSNSPWTLWINTHPEVIQIVDEAALIVSSLTFSERTIPKSKTDDLWLRINETIVLEEDTKVLSMPRRNIFRLFAYAVAACVVLLFASRILINNDENIYIGSGDTLAHVLPDASEIMLNADSKISYDKGSWDTNRSLSLEGEGYFEVEKGQKFVVHTEHGDISVLGTSFNIYSRSDGFSVHCTSGKVQVTSGKEEVILTPNTRTILTDGLLVKEEVSAGTKIDWLDKIYRFDAIPLKVVFDAIERQFKVQVTMDTGISERLYTGTFEATDLNKALNTICFPMELSPIIQGNKIRIQFDAGK